MNYLPNARKYLASDLREEFGSAYAVVLGSMSGLKIRAANFPKTKERSLTAEAAGMFRALVLILGTEHAISENDARKLIAEHDRQWKEATAEDAAAATAEDAAAAEENI